MATPNVNRVKCVLSGLVFPGQSWSVGIWCEVVGQQGGADSARLEGYLNELAAPISLAIGNTIASAWDGNTLFNRISLYGYAPGAAVAQYVANRDVAPITGQSGTTGPLPAYVAAVTTLLTPLSGRRYRGRIYWPLTGARAVANFRVSPDSVKKASDATVGVLEALSDVGGGVDGNDLVPVVQSTAGGFVTPITAVSTDDLPDAQRNRDNSLTVSLRNRQALVA